MILGVVAPAGKKVTVVMGEHIFTGSFNSHTFPFASFNWDEEINPIYIQIDRIDTIIPLEKEDGLGRIIDASSEQVRSILGKHSTEVTRKS